MADSANSTNNLTLTQGSSSNRITYHLPNLSPKLDRNNFQIWKSNVMNALHIFRLHSFVLSYNPPPSTVTSQGETSVTVPNSNYEDWHQCDLYVLLWLKQTISDPLLPYVITAKSSFEAWNIIERLFQTQAKSCVRQATSFSSKRISFYSWIFWKETSFSRYLSWKFSNCLGWWFCLIYSLRSWFLLWFFARSSQPTCWTYHSHRPTATSTSRRRTKRGSIHFKFFHAHCQLGQHL